MKLRKRYTVYSMNPAEITAVFMVYLVSFFILRDTSTAVLLSGSVLVFFSLNHSENTATDKEEDTQNTTSPKHDASVHLCSRLISLILLPVFLVLWFLVFVFTALESPGRVLVPHLRVGRNAVFFHQYRFRVFRMDAKESEVPGKSPYTVTGRILKFMHLDDAPMLLNILFGEMVFFGKSAPTLEEYRRMSQSERDQMYFTPGFFGSRDPEDILETEEYEFIRQQLNYHRPMDYDHSPETKKDPVFYLVIKRLFDLVLSPVCIVLLSPVMLVVAAAVSLSDNGNPFYTQWRIGRGGRQFRLYKLRSMRMDEVDPYAFMTPEQMEEYRREFKLEDDPRVTPIGSFIRKTSLDELPQLFNIFFGDMSVVGPRPLLDIEIKENYTGEQIARLLSTRPGLTGYWQAYARNNATYESGERQEMEMYYVDHRSFLLDVKIFFKTFIRVISGV
ncbi:MAG: sugar transferase, partial [Solobacterium sp.]|nr:sugar transferase [Solobacterium sp.]